MKPYLGMTALFSMYGLSRHSLNYSCCTEWGRYAKRICDIPFSREDAHQNAIRSILGYPVQQVWDIRNPPLRFNVGRPSRVVSASKCSKCKLEYTMLNECEVVQLLALAKKRTHFDFLVLSS